MATQLYKYETDSGAIVRIRLSPEKKAVGGNEPAGTISDNRIRVAATGSRRQFNTIIARARVYTRSEATAGGLKAIQTVRIPIMLKSDFDGVTPLTINYKGKDWTFSNLDAED